MTTTLSFLILLAAKFFFDKYEEVFYLNEKLEKNQKHEVTWKDVKDSPRVDDPSKEEGLFSFKFDDPNILDPEPQKLDSPKTNNSLINWQEVGSFKSNKMLNK